MRIDWSTTILRRGSLLCLCLSWFAWQALADTYQRQPGVDALHYAFRLTLSDDSDEIVGEATIDLRFVREGRTESTLDLASVNNGKRMNVSEVQAEGGPLGFAHQADHLRITLGSPSRAGERRQFTVRYRGIPANGLRF